MNKKEQVKRSTQLKVSTQIRGGISLKRIGDKPNLTVNHPEGMGTPDASNLNIEGYSI